MSVVQEFTHASSTALAHDTVVYALNGNCYLNLTAECTLRCKFCPKFDGNWEVRGYDLRLRHRPSAQELIDAIGDVSQYREIVFCGLGEPTQRLDVLLECAAHLKRQGATLRVNTDGLANLVHNQDVTYEFHGVIDALSISLNAQDEETYERHCRPKLPGAYPALLEFIRLAKRHVPHITLTAINGLEGVDIAACRAIADRFGVQFRERQLDVVG